MTHSVAFSLLASLLTSLSMGTYIYRLFRHGSIPNASTWSIWLIIGLLNLVTYFEVAGAKLWQALPLVFVVCGILTVTVYSTVKGRFSRIGFLDQICFGLALLVGAFWQSSGDPVLANLLLQVVYAISFVPTVAGLRSGMLRETLAPWTLAIAAYTLMIGVVLLDWSQQSWVALAHPVINGLMGNGLVAFYAWHGPVRVRAPLKAWSQEQAEELLRHHYWPEPTPKDHLLYEARNHQRSL